jgi:Predicted transcriptional regulator
MSSYEEHLWEDEVRKKLSEKHWNQVDLARVIGVTPAMISYMLNEKKGSDELRLKVSKALNVKSNWKKFK